MADPVRADPGGFGAALRRARTERGLSLAGLARLVHYSRGYLSKLETGFSTPNAALAQRCDDALGTGDLLAGLVPHRRRRPAAPTAAPAGDRVALLARPFDVPPVAAHFTGRDAELDTVIRLLTRPAPGAGSVPVVVLHGMGGVGKSALAAVAAHRLDQRYPDGCLFVGLHSYAQDQPAVPVAEALDTVLRRLGVPGPAIPSRVDDRIALYRSVLHDRRMLVVIDDARRADQVTPLIPAGPGSAVLVTSRRRLTALDDAHPVRVDPLGLPAATTLFRSIAGVDPAGPAGAPDPLLADVVRSCGLLPLTVRIAAARQRGGEPGDLADLARRLADGRLRLAELDDGERSATAVLATSCADLTAVRRRLLALLTLQPGAGIPRLAAGWLADLDAETCRRELAGLIDDNLLLAPVAGRHRLHDLTRAYATDVLLAEMPEPDRTAALRRLVTGYLDALGSADRLLTPGRYRPAVEDYTGAAPAAAFADAEAAHRWLTAEQDALIAVCRLAATHGWHDACWQLAYGLRGYFFLAKAWDAWLETHRLALPAAQSTGNEWAVAVTRNNLGLALIERGHVPAAIEQYAQALPIFRRLGDRAGEGATLGHQAWARYRSGHDQATIRLGRAALDCYESVTSGREAAQRGIGITLRTIAMAEARLGRVADADRDLRRALALFVERDMGLDATMALNNLGGLHAKLGQPRDAARWFAAAIDLGRACDSSYEQARAYDGLTTCATAAGLSRATRRFAERSRALYDALHIPDADRRRISPVGPNSIG